MQQVPGGDFRAQRKVILQKWTQNMKSSFLQAQNLLRFLSGFHGSFPHGWHFFCNYIQPDIFWNLANYPGCQLFQQNPWFWLNVGDEILPTFITWNISATIARISFLSNYRILFCCLCSNEAGSRKSKLTIGVWICVKVTEPRNARSTVNSTSALYVAKYFETHVYSRQSVMLDFFPASVEFMKATSLATSQIKSCLFFGFTCLLGTCSPFFMDGNGEAAGDFQLKVGGLFSQFPGTVVQVEHCEGGQNGCFTIAFHFSK